MPLAMASHRDHAARMTTPISAATARPKSTANAKVRMKSTAVLSGCRAVISIDRTRDLSIRRSLQEGAEHRRRETYPRALRPVNQPLGDQRADRGLDLVVAPARRLLQLLDGRALAEAGDVAHELALVR